MKLLQQILFQGQGTNIQNTLSELDVHKETLQKAVHVAS